MPPDHDSLLPTPIPPPAFALSAALPHAVVGAEVAAVPVLPADDATTLVLGPGADEIGAELGVDLLEVLASQRATGAAGEVVALPVPLGTGTNTDLRLLLLVGVGDQGPTALRRAGAAVARAARDRASVATTVATGEQGLEPFVVGAMLGSFTFAWRAGEPEFRPVGRVVLAGRDDRDAAALERAVAIGRAGWRARTLATVPSNLKNPPWLAEQALAVAEEAGLRAEVWDEERLAAEGFGGILGVGQASATPPRLLRLDYTPRRATRRTPTVVLVGKGITFDSGGLSIKPGQAMSTMKRDMTGGAVVLATMAALRDVGCPVRVVGLVAAAENAVSGSSLRPGDVLRHYGGRTTEVTNTDAEGRLVMADALAYAVAEIKPAALVDVATLTGAVKVALGQQVGGFFASDDALAGAIESAGTAAGEPLWRMPLERQYAGLLDSRIADADNAPGGPGAITAALFLQPFTGGLPWAHLDVASVGDAPEDKDEWTQGPTGFGARALLTWLGSDDPLAGIGD